MATRTNDPGSIRTARTPRVSSQLDEVLVVIREQILNGDLKAGERLAEVPLSERLGVSRTPVRHALTLLQAEGLLETAGARGYEVKRFSVNDITDAIEVRGALEGLAARTVAENGVTRRLRNTLDECVAGGDTILDVATITSDVDIAFAKLNARFHSAIVAEAGNAALSNAISLNDKLPFAAAASVAWEFTTGSQRRRMLLRAQIEHALIRDALVAGQGARAESLMKEHAYVAMDAVRVLAREHADSDDVVPELSVRLRGRAG